MMTQRHVAEHPILIDCSNSKVFEIHSPERTSLVRHLSNKRSRIRQLSMNPNTAWLFGCATRNRLYRFPCHLFSTCDNVWTVNETEEVCLSAVGPLCKMTITICKLLDRCSECRQLRHV